MIGLVAKGFVRYSRYRNATRSNRDSLLHMDDELQRWVSEFARGMKTLPKDVAKKGVRRAALVAGNKFKERLKVVAPVNKNGSLKRPGRSTKFHRGMRGFTVRIGYDKKKVYWATMVEDGTKQRRTKPGGFFKSGANRGRVTPRHFLKTMYTRYANQLANDMAKQLKLAFESQIRKIT